MSTKVSAFMGGLGRDARNKLELQDNATVQIGTASTGNLLVGATVAISNTNPSQGDGLVVGGNIRLTSGSLIYLIQPMQLLTLLDKLQQEYHYLTC